MLNPPILNPPILNPPILYVKYITSFRMSILNMWQFNQQNQNGMQTGENVPQTTYGQAAQEEPIVQRLLSPQTTIEKSNEEYSKKMKIKRLRAQDLYFTEEQTLLNKEYHEKRRRIWRPMKVKGRFRNMIFRYFDFWKKKMRKDLIQKLKRMTNVPKTGISVNGRNGSTRNGFVVSVSRYHRPALAVQEIIHRNTLLQVNSDVCFWCKTQPATVLDHAHPCCSMKRTEFSWTNKLNIFPSCTQCNQTKGGNSLLDWLTMNVVVSNWSSEQINTFQNWLSLNDSKLLFDSEYTALTVQQFSTINKFHQVMELCAKNKKHAGDFLDNTLDRTLEALYSEK